MNRNATPKQRLVRARTQLLLNHPFFGTLAIRLRLVRGDLPTMATDGRRIVYNPGFVQRLTPAELEGVLAHEVMHCALAHHCRRCTRNPRIWNEAADYAVNPLLLGAGVTLPAGVLVNPEFAGLSAEEIYARLYRQSPESTPEQPSASPSPGASPDGSSEASVPADDHSVPAQPSIGEVLDAVDEDRKPATQASLERQRREWAIAAEQAIRSAKACGREPAGVERPLNETKESAIDWRSVLRDFVAATRVHRTTAGVRRTVDS
jgi:predicted metal-dependent peptidase